MNIAVLFDIHGNLPALEAVLAEPEVAQADRIVLLGDIALGPMPGATLDRLAVLGTRAIWVHGNCECELLLACAGLLEAGPHDAVAEAAASMITQQHQELIRGLPLTVTLPIDEMRTALFCHATPGRDDEFILVDSPIQSWQRVLAGFTEDLKSTLIRSRSAQGSPPAPDTGALNLQQSDLLPLSKRQIPARQGLRIERPHATTVAEPPPTHGL